MAEFNNIVPNVQAWPKTLQRTNHFLMDYYGAQADYSAILSYAENSAAAAVGQIVYAKSDDLVAGKKAGLYLIKSYGEGAEIEAVREGSGSIVASSYDELVAACDGNHVGSIVVLTSNVNDGAEENAKDYSAGLYVVGAGNTIASLKSLSTSAADGSSIESQVESLETQVGTLQTTVGNAEGGLVKAVADNTSAIADKADASLVATLVGDDENKSVREIAAEELAAQLIPENAQESLDTLQEIAAWIQAHPEDASQMNSDIASLQASIGVASKAAEGTEGEEGYVAPVVATGLTARIEALESSAAGIDDAITAKIGSLDSEKSGENNGVSVTVKEVAGLIDSVTVVAPDFANTYEEKGAAAAVKTALIGSADTDTKDSDTLAGVRKYAADLVANISDPTNVTSDAASAIKVDSSVANTFKIAIDLDNAEDNSGIVLSQSANGLKAELNWNQYE